MEILRDIPDPGFLTSHPIILFHPPPLTLQQLAFVFLSAVSWIRTENLPLSLSVPPAKPLSSPATSCSPHSASPSWPTDGSFFHNALTWTSLSSFIPSIPHTLSLHTEFITFLQTCQHLCNFMPLQIFLPHGIPSLSPLPTWKTLAHSSKPRSHITSSGLSEILPGKVNLFCWTPLEGVSLSSIAFSASLAYFLINKIND